VGTGLFGRTNRAFPPIWLSLAAPNESEEIAPLVAAAVQSNTVVDISAHPGLFGGFMRGSSSLLMSGGGHDLVHAPDEDGAANLIHAHLIETLCSIGREWIDFYFLRLRAPLEEFQLAGAIRALDWAREEGHVKFVGLGAEADPVVVLGAWQFHDAFEAVLLPSADSAYQGLQAMALKRRVGIVIRQQIRRADSGQTSLVTVRSKKEAVAALEPALAPL
jgi:hypothetical protein